MRALQDTKSGEVDFPIRYFAVQPNRWTFQADKIRHWVESWLSGRVLNACAGKTELTHDGEIVRNDINPERDADMHVDVTEISDHFEANSFDTVVFDPPFSEKQAESTYDGIDVSDGGRAMNEFDELLRSGGRVIKMGFSTTCMPGERDYQRRAVAIFNTLGRMNDWLGTVDERMSADLREFTDAEPTDSFVSIPSVPTGDQFKQARLDLNITQTELADVLEVDNSTISRWEREEYMNLKNARRYADALTELQAES